VGWNWVSLQTCNYLIKFRYLGIILRLFLFGYFIKTRTLVLIFKLKLRKFCLKVSYLYQIRCIRFLQLSVKFLKFSMLFLERFFQFGIFFRKKSLIRDLCGGRGENPRPYRDLYRWEAGNKTSRKPATGNRGSATA